MGVSGVGELREVPVDVVRAPANPMRRVASEEALSELRADIRRNGILVPLLVTEEGDGYRLVAGLRRLTCARSLGLATVPALVVERDERWRSYATLAENRLREDVNPVDEGLWMAALVEGGTYTRGELADMLSVSLSSSPSPLLVLSLLFSRLSLQRGATPHTPFLPETPGCPEPTPSLPA